MKRNSIITIIAVIGIAIVLISSQNASNKGNTFSSLSNKFFNLQHTDPTDITKQVLSQKETKLPAIPKVFLAKGSNTGTIGMMDGSSVDNPSDNVFHIQIDRDFSENSQAYLEYELFGVRDFNSICKGINDQVSFGGMFVKIANIWSNQTEKISTSNLRKGDNIIRFSVPVNCEFGYKVRNVKIRFEDNETMERTLVVNSPSTHYFFKKYGYLNGFATGKGSDKVKFYANGKQIRSFRSAFEGRVEKENDTLDQWNTIITAVFEDGQQLSTTVQFDKASLWDYSNEYNPEIPYSEIQASKFTEINLQQLGFMLQGEKESMLENKKISVTGLRAEDMALMNSGMINVTAVNNGFRCLPHNSKFEKNLKIHIQYDTTKIPRGYSPKDIRTFYFDESANRWVMLPIDTVDIVKNEVISYTNHFTDFVNGILKTPEAPQTSAFTPTSMKDIKFADPLAGYNIIAPPSANNSGTANLDFSIEIPQGRQGMQPQISLHYNSEGGNGLLGTGWDMSLQSITVETRWGVPTYDSLYESESYILNGQQLLPLQNRTSIQLRDTSTAKRFFPRVEGSFNKIIRKGDNPKRYYWIVTDKQGVSYYYGAYSTDINANSQCVLRGDNGVASWLLAEVRDLHGNYIRYNYSIYTGSQYGKEILLDKITYTGYSTNVGKHEVLIKYETRSDVTSSGRFGFIDIKANRIRSITTKYSEQLIKEYKFAYTLGSNSRSLLCLICETNDTTQFSQDITCESDFTPRDKVHKFKYQSENTVKFSAEEEIIDSTFDSFDLIQRESQLKRNYTHGVQLGGGLGVKFGSKSNKDNEIGGNYLFHGTKTETELTFMDIDGDGLLDKVYEDDGEYYYKKLKYYGNSLIFEEAQSLTIGDDLDDLGRTKTRTHYFGLEGHLNITDTLALNGSGGLKEKTVNTTNHYFSDINADGLPDYINEGQVYFNKLVNGVPTFSLKTSDTIYIGNGLCDYVIYDGDIDGPGLLENVDISLPEVNHKAVRMWKAPRSGQIAIDFDVQYITPGSIKYHIFKDTASVLTDVNLSPDTIDYMHFCAFDTIIYDCTDLNPFFNSIAGIGVTTRWEFDTNNCYPYYVLYTNLSDTLMDTIPRVYCTRSTSNLNVIKDNVLYFVMETIGERFDDNIYWHPSISYISNHDVMIDTLKDANSKYINRFDSDEDFILGMPLSSVVISDGQMQFSGIVTGLSLSDTVWLELRKNDSLFASYRVDPGSSFTKTINDLVNVSEYDEIDFIARANTEVDWSSIEDSLIGYYPIDSLKPFTFQCFPILQIKPFSNEIKKSKPYKLVPGTYQLSPQMAVKTGQTVSGEIVFSVKKSNDIIKKKVLNINNNVLPSGTVDFTLIDTTTLYFDFYSSMTDLPSKVDSLFIKISKTSYNAGNFCQYPDSMIKFGALYRGWGQFVWNSNSVINPGLMTMYQYSIDTSWLTMDTTAVKNLNDTNSTFISFNSHVTAFIPMIPDKNRDGFMEYSNTTFIGSRKVCHSESDIDSQGDNDNSEKTYAGNIIPEIVSGKKPLALNKVSVDKLNSYALGVGSTVNYNTGLSGSYTEGSSEVYSEMMDMNGDGFPDLVCRNKTQFTNSRGGLRKSAIGHFSGDIYNSYSKSYGGAVSSDFIKAKIIKKKIEVNSFSASYVYGDNDVKCLTFDYNGDGLPDKFNENGTISINLGYGFENIGNGNTTTIEKSEGGSNTISLSGGLEWQNEFLMTAKSKNKSENSIGAGANISGSENHQKSFVIADMNSDGLPDMVKQDNDSLIVVLNSGNGFNSPSNAWTELDNKLEKSKSIHISGAVTYSLAIPIYNSIKLIINPTANYQYSMSFDNLSLMDINNDGYTDIVRSDADEFTVQYNLMGKENKLIEVSTPSLSKYLIDYKISQSDANMPQRKWVMSNLKIYDGFKGDGQDTIYYAYEYKNGYYSRFEREFFGFDTVKEFQYNTFNSGAQIYRSNIYAYHTNDYMFKGLLKYKLQQGGTTNKYVESFYTYKKKEIETGIEIDPATELCFGPYYPAISQSDVFYYEGTSDAQIKTKENFVHGKYGNVIRYYNYGDTADNDDNLVSLINYSYDTTKNLLSMVQSIVIKDHDSTLLRSRSATYTPYGEVTKLSVNNTSSVSEIDITYDMYGNVQTITSPLNSNNDRMVYTTYYDNILHTYPVTILDPIGTSTNVYDYRLGAPIETTDISGNKIQYSYYIDGKPNTIRGPKEIESGAPYTIKFDYWNEIITTDTILWAKTTHYDPINSGNDFISVSFSDGLGRNIQSKQKATVLGSDSLIVSGKVNFDAYGRPFSNRLPITEAIGLGTEYIFNLDSNALNAALVTYDVMDRPLTQVAPDQTSSQISYGFGDDAFGKKCFKSTIIDQKNIPSSSFMDVRGLQTSVQNPYSTITKFEYNALSEMVSSTDPEDNLTTFSYDLVGKLLQRIHPDAGTTTYEYDDAGNLTSLRTSNLNSEPRGIEYRYEYNNQLTKIIYPQNPENNVFYEYGSAGNDLGKLKKVQDASGVQEFSYGNMGEVVQNIHTFVVPNGQNYTYQMNWEYDTWNRLKNITYPDGEVVNYSYDNSGQLRSLQGEKCGYGYSYINNINYTSYGNRNSITYGNNTQTLYTYNPLNQRLTNLKSYDGSANLMQNLSYSYDYSGNIISVGNSAGYVNTDMAGNYGNYYTYDSLYRLSTHFGYFTPYNQSTIYNSLSMSYSLSGSITNKTLNATTLVNGVSQTKNYNNNYSYIGSKPHAITEIDDNGTPTKSFVWDANGNMTQQTEGANVRNLCWDEENRLTTVSDLRDGTPTIASSYLYNAGGERVWKLSGIVQQMKLNGGLTVNSLDLNQKTLYTSSYMVMTDNEYTKHYYIEGERVCSKLGSGFSDAPIDPFTSQVSPIDTERDYQHIASDLWEMTLRGLECAGLDQEYVDIEPELNSAHNIDCTNEPDQYFYHSDHLGSSSFITDVSGNATQQLQYLPFGEIFVDQRNSSFDSRFKFSAKEKDEETGYSYFGARYYDSDISIWLSVDPLAGEAPEWTPYRYGYYNPVNWIDVNGNIEAPLKGTQVWHENKLKRITTPNRTIRSQYGFLGNDKDVVYNYAFLSVGKNPKNAAQQEAQKNGTLIKLHSEFFKIRDEGSSPHVGVDYRAKMGSNVYSYGDGVIVASGKNGAGMFVTIKYSNGDVLNFMHLSSIESFIKGQKVYEGQIIGKSGTFGSGPHLHVSARNSSGVIIDPTAYPYGTCTNEQFFTIFGGDYKKLLDYKQSGVSPGFEGAPLLRRSPIIQNVQQDNTNFNNNSMGGF